MPLLIGIINAHVFNIWPENSLPHLRKPGEVNKDWMPLVSSKFALLGPELMLLCFSLLSNSHLISFTF